MHVTDGADYYSSCASGHPNNGFRSIADLARDDDTDFFAQSHYREDSESWIDSYSSSSSFSEPSTGDTSRPTSIRNLTPIPTSSCSNPPRPPGLPLVEAKPQSEDHLRTERVRKNQALLQLEKEREKEDRRRTLGRGKAKGSATPASEKNMYLPSQPSPLRNVVFQDDGVDSELSFESGVKATRREKIRIGDVGGMDEDEIEVRPLENIVAKLNIPQIPTRPRASPAAQPPPSLVASVGPHGLEGGAVGVDGDSTSVQVLGQSPGRDAYGAGGVMMPVPVPVPLTGTGTSCGASASGSAGRMPIVDMPLPVDSRPRSPPPLPLVTSRERVGGGGGGGSGGATVSAIPRQDMLRLQDQQPTKRKRTSSRDRRSLGGLSGPSLATTRVDNVNVNAHSSVTMEAQTRQLSLLFGMGWNASQVRLVDRGEGEDGIEAIMS